MFHRTLVSLILSATTSLGVLASGGGANDAVKEPIVVPHVSQVDKVPSKQELAIYELVHQDRMARIPTMEYWHKVAQCESQNRWKDKGMFAGGLGIYTKGRFVPKDLRYGKAGTWEYFGGEEFAPSPDKATKIQQIVIANRIALFGYHTTFNLPAGYKGAMMTFEYNKKPVGFNGWGCIRNTIGKPKHKDLQ